MLWQAEIFLLWVLIVNRLRASRQGYEIWRAAFPERQKKKKKKNFPIAVRDLRSAVTGGAGLIIRAGEIVIVSVQLWGC